MTIKNKVSANTKGAQSGGSDYTLTGALNQWLKRPLLYPSLQRVYSKVGLVDNLRIGI
jgi:hypothetical protein